MKEVQKLQINAIENGTVIDHLPSNKTLKVMNLLKLGEAEETVTVAFNLKSGSHGAKGIIKIANKKLTAGELEKIAVLAPKVTVNVIKEFKVVEKIKPELPTEIKNIVECQNPKCITNAENIPTKFIINKENHTAKCYYCERTVNQENIKVKG